ncbi:MAG: 4a-hydroxytetrahydrobiopterin dehydratase [Verrucomicrobiota bacterium]
MADLLEEKDLERLAKKVPEWEIDETVISRTYEFDEFSQSIDFVNDVSEIAEEAQHHPEILIQFTTVTISSTTHDEGGLTSLDFDLATKIDNLVD